MVKVMISSTVKDLKEERECLRRELEELGFEVLMSEKMGSESTSSKEVCLRMVAECDLYILIIGRIYGTVIENENISITEMEFREYENQRKI